MTSVTRHVQSHQQAQEVAWLSCKYTLGHVWTCHSHSPFCKLIWTHSICVCISFFGPKTHDDYQPKVTTLEFVLARVIVWNWHLIRLQWTTFANSLVNSSTKALSIQQYYTPYAHLSRTIPFLSPKYKVISMHNTTHLVLNLHHCSYHIC